MRQIADQYQRIQRESYRRAYTAGSRGDDRERSRQEQRVSAALNTAVRYRRNMLNSMGNRGGDYVTNEQFNRQVPRSVYMGLRSAMGSRG